MNVQALQKSGIYSPKRNGESHFNRGKAINQSIEESSGQKKFTGARKIKYKMREKARYRSWTTGSFAKEP